MSTAAEIARPAAAVRKGRFAPNLLANVGNLGLSLVIGFWYVPFLVSHLGPAVYGLIPLASSLMSFIALVTQGLNLAVARFLTIALEQADDRQANRVFNTSLWANLAIGAALVAPATLAVVHLDRLIQIPAGYEAEARWLLAATMAAFLLSELKTPFDVSTFCRNRFDLHNLVAAGETLTRVGLILLLFHLLAPQLRHVGLATLCGAVVSALGAVWLWRTLTPTLRVQWREFDRGVLRRLTSTGGWVVVNQVGAILYLSIDLLVANHLFGAEASGRYAAVMQPAILIRTLGATVAAVFAPTILFYFAGGDLERLVAWVRSAIKFVGLLLVLPISLACGFAEPLLRLWLGADFSHLAPLLVVMTAHLCINMAIQPLLSVQLAADRYRVPGLVTLGMGLGNLGLALLLAGPVGWGVYGIAAAGAIMLLAKNTFFTPLYGARVLGRPWGTFLQPLAPLVVATGVTAGACRLLMHGWEITHWGHLAAAGTAVSLLYAGAVYGLLFSPAEREALKNILRKTKPHDDARP